jgi:RNA polymerase sigma-70 factor, ECF subfamily
MISDEELVERCRSGDRDAFELLFTRHRDSVYNLALGISRSAETAEDITQEVFVRAYIGLSGFRGRAKLTTWLYRIAVNQALRTRSVRSRRADKEQPMEDVVLPSREPEPEQAAERAEMEESVRRAIRELSPAQRAVVSLRYIEGLDLAEVAEIMGSPLGTIKSRIHHALKSMSLTLRDMRDA